MGNSKKVQAAVDEINSIKQEIMAESVVNSLIQAGWDFDEFDIHFESTHKRGWEKDIFKAESGDPRLILRLTRDGIFQSLPEYLFMKPVEGSMEEIVEVINFNNRQKEIAKQLFNPIERLIFNGGIILEQFENEQIASLSFGDNTSIQNFFRIDKKLFEHDLIKINRLIPYVHNIVGKLSSTAGSLSYLLGVDVNVKEERKMFFSEANERKEDEAEIGLGEYQCGINLVFGNTLSEHNPLLSFLIGPINDDEVEYYLDGREKSNLIECFTSYFVPIQYETEFTLVIDSDHTGFLLDNTYMGYNSLL